MRALVVRTVVGNRLGTGAQAHHRHDDRRLDRTLARRGVGDQLHFVVHHALRAGHRRALAHEPGKRDVDAAGVRFEPDQQGVEEARKRRQRQRLGELVDRRDQARHVRALAIRRQRDVGAANGDRRLRRIASVDEANRIAQISYADAVDRQAAARRGATGHRVSAVFRDDSLRWFRVERGAWRRSPSLSHSSDRAIAGTRNANVAASIGRRAEASDDRCGDALGVETAVRELAARGRPDR